MSHISFPPLCSGPWSLTAVGVGGTIGAGIFVVRRDAWVSSYAPFQSHSLLLQVTGLVAKTLTGPALCLSYVVSGFVCLLCSLCYAEFAAMVRDRTLLVSLSLIFSPCPAQVPRAGDRTLFVSLSLIFSPCPAQVPRAGSAYTYAHATLGQLMGWISRTCFCSR
jgi:amino acid transporter